jgi:hypothetical protein
MTTDILAVMTVITLLEGMAYAPWVKVILLFGMVPVELAYCWRAVARYVMHPDSRALASMLLMGFTQIDRRLKHASRYASTPSGGLSMSPRRCGRRCSAAGRSLRAKPQFLGPGSPPTVSHPGARGEHTMTTRRYRCRFCSRLMKRSILTGAKRGGGAMWSFPVWSYCSLPLSYGKTRGGSSPTRFRESSRRRYRP